MASNKKSNQEPDREIKLQNGFAAFVEKNIKVIVIVAVAVVVIVAAALIIASVNGNKTTERFVAIDRYDSDYSSLTIMDETSEEYQSAKAELEANLATLVNGNDYPAHKAQFLSAMLLHDEGRETEAAEAFRSLATSLRNDNYMAPLSYYNAGVCYENAGDLNAALDAYQTIWDTWNTEAAESPKALFSVARLQEQRGNRDLAEAALTQLRDQFPNSEYARLAMNRLVAY